MSATLHISKIHGLYNGGKNTSLQLLYPSFGNSRCLFTWVELVLSTSLIDSFNFEKPEIWPCEIWLGQKRKYLNQSFPYMSLSFYSFFLEDLLISGKPLLTSGNGFNVDFVNKELPPLPATDSVRNNNMSDRHSQRAYEQTCFYSSNVCSPTKTRRNTDHIRSFQRHINQRQYRTERCNPQIRPSRQPRSIAQTINA